MNPLIKSIDKQLHTMFKLHEQNIEALKQLLPEDKVCSFEDDGGYRVRMVYHEGRLLEVGDGNSLWPADELKGAEHIEFRRRYMWGTALRMQIAQLKEQLRELAGRKFRSSGMTPEGEYPMYVEVGHYYTYVFTPVEARGAFGYFNVVVIPKKNSRI